MKHTIAADGCVREVTRRVGRTEALVDFTPRLSIGEKFGTVDGCLTFLGLDLEPGAVVRATFEVQ